MDDTERERSRPPRGPVILGENRKEPIHHRPTEPTNIPRTPPKRPTTTYPQPSPTKTRLLDVVMNLGEDSPSKPKGKGWMEKVRSVPTGSLFQPKKTPVSVPVEKRESMSSGILKSGWLVVDSLGHWCELYGDLVLACKTDEFNGEEVKSLNLRYKYVEIVNKESKKHLAMFKIKDETRGTVARIEADNSDKLVEWVSCIEGAMFSLYNKDNRASNIRSQDKLLKHRISVWVGTWNVGNTSPCSLEKWLPSHGNYDIIAVGAQECTYTSIIEQSSEQDWFQRVIDTVGPKYFVLASCSLWEIRNIVFVKNCHAPYVTPAKTDTVATGIANTMGNKGGVGIYFMFHDTSLCFISSHLAAHQEEITTRNNNFKDIIQKMRFDNTNIDITNRAEHVFFYGDLNYRVDFPYEEALETLTEGKSAIPKLFAHDQLALQIQSRTAFYEFNEMPINFFPTYRLLRNTWTDKNERVYSPEKLRIPSWCDRVLWKSFPCSNIEPETYSSVPDLDTSDHCPVYATFQVDTQLNPHLLSSALSPEQLWKVLVSFIDVKVSVKKVLNKRAHVFCRVSGRLYSKKNTLHSCQNAQASNWVWSAFGEEVTYSGVTQAVEYWDFQHVILEFIEVSKDEISVERNIPVGQAIVSLKGSHRVPVDFTVDVLKNGECIGKASGVVSVRFSR
eukprot:TRINITY_DN4870_c0_g1_i2.p1 TRINITY_DN4870_c0_g1~~TRINITY_DN4870_c0_g1_i2.p1  ORF type:complete len:673 (-),score=67.40 TRINITY_DN4870_c0_g1_i2:37-2055(-)